MAQIFGSLQNKHSSPEHQISLSLNNIQFSPSGIPQALRTHAANYTLPMYNVQKGSQKPLQVYLAGSNLSQPTRWWLAVTCELQGPKEAGELPHDGLVADHYFHFIFNIILPNISEGLVAL